MICYQTERLREVLSAFECATGIRIAFLDAEGRFSVSSDVPPSHSFCTLVHGACGEAACSASDARLYERCKRSRVPEIHRCHAGLLDTCAPIIKGDLILGYLIFGQMRPADADMPSESVLCAFDDRESILREYRAIPSVSEERLRATVKLACMLASYIIREDMILLQESEEAKRLERYVEENLDRELTVARICRDLHTSKTALYRLFGENVGCGVKHYLAARRMERAKELLTESELSVTEIAAAVGIVNLHYFCRVFKKKTGYTPLEFRKNKRSFHHV